MKVQVSGLPSQPHLSQPQFLRADVGRSGNRLPGLAEAPSQAQAPPPCPLPAEHVPGPGTTSPGLPGTEASPTPGMSEVVTTWVRAGFLGGPAATPPPRARPRHRDPGLPGTLVHAALKTSLPHDGRSRGPWRCRAGRWRQALRPVTHGRGLNYRGRGCGAWRCPGNCIQQMHHADLLKY